MFKSRYFRAYYFHARYWSPFVSVTPGGGGNPDAWRRLALKIHQMGL